MSALITHVRESVLTSPEDTAPHALVEWARGEAALPWSEHVALDALCREWWLEQSDARDLLRALTLAHHRSGVLGACACARWALERHRTDENDRRPWIAVETTERWCRGEATLEQVLAARDGAWNAAADDAAAYAAYASASASDADAAAAYAADAADASAYAADAAWDQARAVALRDLCDVVRAAVECPPAECWLRGEL